MKLTEKQEKVLSCYTRTVQQNILNLLKAYSEVRVMKNIRTGLVEVVTHVMLQNCYDDVELETIRSKDVYTEEELILNYLDEFIEYPIEYEGERDYNLLSDLHSLKRVKQYYVLKFNPKGDIVLIISDKIRNR